MGRLLTGSINLSKIDKEKIFTSKKGEKFISINVWLNEDVDQYGNIASIKQYRKDVKETLYLGNLKDYKAETQTENVSTNDDLPY